MNMKFAIELVAVGVSSMIMGLLLHYVLGYHAQHANSPTMNKEMMQLVILLFLTGAFLHLFFEVTKMNAWYCKNGNASLADK